MIHIDSARIYGCLNGIIDFVKVRAAISLVFIVFMMSFNFAFLVITYNSSTSNS